MEVGPNIKFEVDYGISRDSCKGIFRSSKPYWPKVPWQVVGSVFPCSLVEIWLYDYMLTCLEFYTYVSPRTRHKKGSKARGSPACEKVLQMVCSWNPQRHGLKLLFGFSPLILYLFDKCIGLLLCQVTWPLTNDQNGQMVRCPLTFWTNKFLWWMLDEKPDRRGEPKDKW